MLALHCCKVVQIKLICRREQASPGDSNCAHQTNSAHQQGRDTQQRGRDPPLRLDAPQGDGGGRTGPEGGDGGPEEWWDGGESGGLPQQGSCRAGGKQQKHYVIFFIKGCLFDVIFQMLQLYWWHFNPLFQMLQPTGGISIPYFKCYSLQPGGTLILVRTPGNLK